MIKVNNLTKIYKTYQKTGNLFIDIFRRQYQKIVALDKVSFQIDNNELVGFIGPNGAGKTTTMKILSGILYPTSGEVKVLNYIPFEKKHSFLREIAFIMGQRNQLIWELPATDTFLLNKEIYQIDDSKYKKTVSELIELLECQKFINQPVKTLSLGQRMRLELIASLIHRPKILFLDEPTIGLDIFAQTTIINFIKEYQKRYQATVIFTSHYMEDVRRLSTRLIIINKGKIIYDGPFAKIIKKYSQTKIINLTLEKPLKQDFSFPLVIKSQYQFPQLKLLINKNDLASILNYLLKKVDYFDLTIEDEPIEEIIKKLFKS